MSARVIGVGARLRGDDGVGPRVVEHLDLEGLPEVERVPCADTTEVPALVTGVDHAILVDAVVEAGPPGAVLVRPPEDFAGEDEGLLVSTHGMSLLRALDLARVLEPAAIAPRITIVAVSIPADPGFREDLSPSVAAAVPRAADAILRLLRDERVAAHA